MSTYDQKHFHNWINCARRSDLFWALLIRLWIKILRKWLWGSDTNKSNILCLYFLAWKLYLFFSTLPNRENTPKMHLQVCFMKIKYLNHSIKTELSQLYHNLKALTKAKVKYFFPKVTRKIFTTNLRNFLKELWSGFLHRKACHWLVLMVCVTTHHHTYRISSKISTLDNKHHSRK